MRLRRLSFAVLPLALAACAPAAPPGASPSPAADSLAVPGVSRALAEHRAATLGDVRYRLALDVTGGDTIPGTLALGFTRAADAGELLVDFRGLRLDSVGANGTPVADYQWRDGHVRIPARYLRAGPNELGFRFASRAAEAGASAIRFSEGDSTRFLYTLLVPADASALFPGFDQPDLKGVFAVQITAPRGWTVLANGPLADTAAVPGGVRWRFAETRPISTYLAAFAAGPWRAWESAPPGERPLTLLARPARAAEIDADTLLQLNREALVWLERFFGIAYPFAKYDMLLAPALPFGGMEHPGAVFYNEDRFVFREEPTLTQRLGRKATIRHEVAHQWFGDLVTMEWFDDLWLKEGFSTYMAAKMQDELDPGTGAWKTFYLRNKPLAYATDATSGTTPVWQALPNLELAKSNYGPIVYNKAPAVLKQLEFVVGEDAFRQGVQLFLRRHAYANATWRELLDALEEASGQRLDAFGEQFILRAGMPVIETRLATEGGRVRRLALVQRPARALPGDPGGSWPMALRVRLGYRARPDTVLPVRFAGDTAVVEGAAGLPAPDWVWPNEGDFGYGLFLPDERTVTHLLRHVGTLDDPLLRAMAWGGLWDAVRERRLAPDAWLRLALRELPAERDEQIAALLLDRAETALEQYLQEPEQRTLRPEWEALLLRRAEDERLPYGMRKASLDALLGTVRTPRGLGALRGYLAGERRFQGEPLPQPSRWAAVRTLVATGAADADSLLRAEAARDSTPQAARSAFVAGAAVPTAASKAAYFRRFLDDPDLNEEWVTAALGPFNRPEHTALTLPWLRPALERLPWIRENRRIFFLPSWINAFVGGQHSAEALAVVDAYLAENPELPPDLRRKVLQARDDLERTVAIRRQNSTAVPEIVR